MVHVGQGITLHVVTVETRGGVGHQQEPSLGIEGGTADGEGLGGDVDLALLPGAQLQ